MLACESVTPLGRPVVPEEYITRQMSSGVTSGSRPTGSAPASSASYSSPSPPSGVTSMTCSTAGQPVADLVDQRHQLRPDEQELGARVVDGVVDLVAGEAEVDDRVGRPERRRRQGQLDAGRVVLVEERDHVAATDPLRLQGACQAAYAVVPLRPRPRAAEVGERLGVGRRLRPVGQPVVQERGVCELGGVRGHGGLSSGQGVDPQSVAHATGPGNRMSAGLTDRSGRLDPARLLGSLQAHHDRAGEHDHRQTDAPAAGRAAGPARSVPPGRPPPARARAGSRTRGRRGGAGRAAPASTAAARTAPRARAP